jgi:hypothetical protein
MKYYFNAHGKVELAVIEKMMTLSEAELKEYTKSNCPLTRNFARQRAASLVAAKNKRVVIDKISYKEQWKILKESEK